MPNVVITERLDQACADWLAEHANVIWCRHDEGERFSGELASAEGLVVRTYTQVNAELLDQAPNVKVVGRAGVGLDNIDLDECKRRGVAVVYTPDANTQAVVEYVLSLIFDEIRPRQTIGDPIDDAAFHQMRKDLVGTQFNQLTLGIVGFGRIGKRLARAASALGVKLLVNDLITESDLQSAVDFDFEFADKPTLYANSDIVTLHVDGRFENRHMIDADELQQFKPGNLLINSARGMLIDNDALAAWARNGGRAILDVHDPEPLPIDYPLYGLPTVRLLPHLASRTETALANMSWVVRDVVEVLNGRTPQCSAF